MILVDTSVWIDHLRGGDAELTRLLHARRVSMHPFVVGEIACGNLASRPVVLATLDDLPACLVAEDREVRDFIEKRRLHGRGVGFADCHLLVSTLLSADTLLWTRDRRLGRIAEQMRSRYVGNDVLH